MTGTIATSSSNSAAGSGKSDFEFDVVRSDGGSATITLMYKGQVAKDADGKPITQNTAGWDDAIPWAAGTCSMNYNGDYIDEPSWRIPDGSILGRVGILLHFGNMTKKSQVLEGCIGASANFLENARDAISAKNELNLSTPLVVTGDYGVTVTSTLDKTNIDRGDSATFTISLGGAGGSNGVSKDLFFHVSLATSSSPGTAVLGQDYDIQAAGTGETAKYYSGGDGWESGYYLRLPKGMSQVSYIIHAKPSQVNQASSGPETVNLKLDDYFVVRNPGTPTAYADSLTEPGVLLTGASLVNALTINDPGTLTTVHLDGGIEGLKKTYTVHKGDVISYFFDAYTIPDSLDISDGAGHVGTGGFVSDQHSGQIVATSDKIFVTVIGSESGTLWSLDLTDQTGQPSNLQASTSQKPVTVVEAPPGVMTSPSGTAGNPESGPAVLQLSGQSTLQLISSQSLTVPAFGETSATVAVTAAKEYLVRLVGQEATGNTTDIPDGYLKIFDTGASIPLIETHTSSIEGEPAAFFHANASGNITFKVGSDLPGHGGASKLEVYDATALTSPIVYLEATGTSAATRGTDGEIDVRIHRAGNLSQPATYTLDINGTGSAPIAASDIDGGSLVRTVTFAAGESVKSIAITPNAASQFVGTETASVHLDASSLAPEVFANAQLLGLPTDAAIAISSPFDVTPNTVPYVGALDAVADKSDGHMTFAVNLSAPSLFDVTVSYVTVDDTAIAGVDYLTTSGTLEFLPGETSKQVTVLLLAGAGTQNDRSFNFDLVDPFGVQLDSGSTVSAAIGIATDNGVGTVETTQNAYTLPDNLFNVTFTGTGNFSGFGNSFDNIIVGGASADVLDGGAGIDTLEGAAGDDLYFVQNFETTIIEHPGKGFDSVITYVDYILPSNVEAIYALDGTTATGNNLDNLVNGAYAQHGIILDGQGGNDTVYGSNFDDSLFGGDGSDALYGLGGNDTMTGGSGDDAYFVDQPGDIVMENFFDGQDTIYASVNFTLPTNVEILEPYGAATRGDGNDDANVLLGVASDHGLTLDGHGGNDVIYGSNFDDTLVGGAGDDLLWGFGGNDTMQGGTGNDVYIVEQAGDAVQENPGEGNDTIYASANITLPTNVENLFVYGAATSGTGNAGDNYIVNEFITSGVTLTGSGGNDTFVFIPGTANGTTITDFAGNGAGVGDVLEFAAYGAGATFTKNDATHWQVNYNGGASHDIITFSNAAAIDVAHDVLFV